MLNRILFYIYLEKISLREYLCAWTEIKVIW